MFKENLRIAFSALKAQKSRAIITALIITIGIMALVGILSAIDAIKQSITNNFSNVGSNTFTLRNRGIRFGPNSDLKVYKEISFDEAMMFSNKFKFPGTLTSVGFTAKFDATIKANNKKTNPNIRIVGITHNYLQTGSLDINFGRNFTQQETEGSASFAIIGSKIAQTLFTKQAVEGQIIHIGSYRYKVIGVLKEKGSSNGFSGDNNVYVGINNARQYFTNSNKISFATSTLVENTNAPEIAISQATATFRAIRKIPVGMDNNFEIIKSDAVSKMLVENISFVTLAATIIGFITLMGASISLMNIMLVSVKERTREIGIRKSIGATPAIIRTQFLTEAIVICQLGGIAGVILGIIIGNLVSMLVGGGFLIPWLWIGMGFILCFVVGILAGYYPAAQAAKLDPIEALRYE